MEFVFVGITCFILGVIIGVVLLGSVLLRNVLKHRQAAVEGFRQGLADAQKRKDRKKVDQLELEANRSISTVTTYRCQHCQKTFTVVGPLLEESKCLHCGRTSEPATKMKRDAVAKMRDAEAFDTNPFGEPVKN